MWLAKVALATALAGAVVLACAPDDGSADDNADLYDNSAGAADTKALNGGSSEKGYTPVGFVYANNDGDGIAPVKCTGTLIRPDAVLTMAQCVTDPSGAP